MLDKEKAAVIDGGQSRSEAASEPLGPVLVLHLLLDLLPLDAERRIGEEVVEVAALVAVL